jgi:hypothetical protein
LVRKTDVTLWSELPDESVARLGLRPVASLEAGLNWIRERFPPGFRYAVVPCANVLYAEIEPNETPS